MSPDTIEVAFLIADLSGYTALTEVHGDFHAVEVVSRFGELAAASLAPGARCVEKVGDEVLVVARDASAAVRTALRLREATRKEPLFPAIRAGLHAGRALQEGERFFGSTLNLAARLAAHAGAGQILCTEEITSQAGSLDDVSFHPLETVSFRNVSAPVHVFEVIAVDGKADLVVDPVCRMQLLPETAPARLPFQGRTYHFCSLDCARAFVNAPERFG